MIPRVVGALLVALCIAFQCPAVGAEEERPSPNRGFGLRTGFGLEPDQFVAGLQALLGRRLGLLRFAPSLDFGFGDDVTTYTINGDFELPVRLPRSRSFAYFGTGIGVTHWDFKDFEGDTELGLNLFAGTRLATGGQMNYNIEARFGVGDVPDFRLLVGLLFGAGMPPEPSP